LTRKHPSTIGETLKAYFGRHGLIRRVRQASVVNEWADIVGEQVASVTEPDSVGKDGTLRVRVRSAAWMQELQLMSPTIVRQLGERGKSIKRIHWMLGTFERQ
jgi:predicted nucleic acid-binding Zn ribbon protein